MTENKEQEAKTKIKNLKYEIAQEMGLKGKDDMKPPVSKG